MYRCHVCLSRFALLRPGRTGQSAWSYLIDPSRDVGMRSSLTRSSIYDIGTLDPRALQQADPFLTVHRERSMYLRLAFAIRDSRSGLSRSKALLNGLLPEA